MRPRLRGYRHRRHRSAEVAPVVTPPKPGDVPPSTIEGLKAFARGEYQEAADILLPIVNNWPRGDRTAEFFLGTLYESGQGVPMDLERACALYIRASFDPAVAFGRQAMAALRSPMEQLSPEGFRRCDLLAIVGFDHGFEPALFNLGPAHWVSVDLAGATVGV